ncbi:MULTISPECIES: Clp protease N-terminal domain-containing protein [Streptomyces]|uniref:Peptidase n=2 Tax=Streptomyces halstedii TaxID=1944 RepID=A0ABS6TZD8_STRHA|nr:MULTISPECIES: Clp protease N-terminal domain-containing protein [Streptomyces]AWL37257.1 peptidase [Streptomyces sp. SM18]MBV7673636.1 peptidase [Streptomyces halstedii]
MHHRTPWTPEQAPPNPADDAAPLTDELAAVATGARRRAVRDGDRHTDTAHLLHSLVESDPEVREVFDGGHQLARVLGYLVQRSIGYGLRWQGTREDSGAFPALRKPGTGTGAWSPSAAAAIGRAVRTATLCGRARAGGLDLLAALMADPRCRAVEVLERAGADPALLAARAAHRLTGADRTA